MSIITVLGATGLQGGSVVQKLKANSSWKIRAVTRNPEGKSAKELSSQGIQVVQADLDDAKSLEVAFEGSTAIFAVTNFWAAPFTDPISLNERGQQEYQQILNIGKAASRVSTLKHLVISSLPWAEKVSSGKHKVPHLDYKARGVAEVEAQYPELAAKSTILWVGYYASNMALIPTVKPLFWPAVGKYIWASPSKPEGVIPIAGNISHNVGVTVDKILQKPAQTHGKIVILVTEYLSHEDALKIWEKVSGKEAVYVELTNKSAEALMGQVAVELSAQFRFSEEYPNQHGFEPERTVSVAGLGIADELIGLEGTLRLYSDHLA
ncbi:unnamed protein product [Clonostachys byssicola]|uniref:NmrA-like domain-containing protein n=1 Tax=Clonostachys byssicola TaxID=160290 RepID=A0A9N9UBT5_9HYPO|nr:unnamed protein product [Clonostachys byssicola]